MYSTVPRETATAENTKRERTPTPPHLKIAQEINGQVKSAKEIPMMDKNLNFVGSARKDHTHQMNATVCHGKKTLASQKTRWTSTGSCYCTGHCRTARHPKDQNQHIAS
ncbi:uncharacterized protein ASPGLDRAFT_1282379 [Aspergillus glaucus CBS 516.65]|uniref:Uncharacterized protein n=1 Tax=Aspergillus glaucus CBS 516.65 TaxID=1160497 RepID=A0A1L9V3E3_ASPGL|nr:hypothetical protein ASPGLDRAFT_1282379 [Aspergillus glaucus CBS 516.65]OJJ78453.1 hypothetical protein ASPGLDRAFT_1282379 [Aspergillus glaucus CBS 516.65]